MALSLLHTRPGISSFFCALGASVAVAGSIGCGVQTSALAPTGAAPVGAARLSGHVHGGQQPIAGATVSLYAAGTGGTGVGATSLLTLPVLSDLNGNFSITGDYTCPSAAAEVYIVSRGGNPGLTSVNSVVINNAAAIMVTAIGDCGSLTPSTFISVNEATTVSAAWALAQFVGPNANIGASSTNTTGLRNAFSASGNLVDLGSGFRLSTTLPQGAVIEQRKLFTLANILSACVNSDGTSACAPLFAAATFGGTAPTNVFDAALNIVRHPGQNIDGVFATSPANGPFQPSLNGAPHDWTMSITYVGGGINLPSAVALDSGGNVWAANYSSGFGGPATKLSPNGHPITATGYSDPSLHESVGIAVDSFDNAWITNQESNYYVNGGSGSVTKISSAGTILSSYGFVDGGIHLPASIAADSDGTMWVANYGNSTVSHLATDGSSLLGPGGIRNSATAFPTGVAVDGSHNAWFAVESAATKVTTAGTVSEYGCCGVQQGIALDPVGNIWVANFSSDSLVELAPDGSITQPVVDGGGILRPEVLASDSAGNIFVTCSDGSSFSAFTPGSRGAPSTPLSPAAGFGLDANLSTPLGLAIDASGNLWIANFSATWLTEFLGVAAPVKTPLLGLPQAP